MRDVRQELENIEKALHEPQTEAQWHSYYAAQQALLWALDANSVKSPYDMISAGILVAPIDCLNQPYQMSS